MVAQRKRQFVWTVIPSGRVVPIDGQDMALCSLLLTPRLLGPADPPLQLTDFGLQGWPQRLAAVSFSALRADSHVPVRQVPYVGIDGASVQFTGAQQQSAWTVLFPPDMVVQPYQPVSYSGRRVVEFPASQAGAQITAAYRDSSQVLAGVSRADESTLRASLRAVNDTWQAGLRRQDRLAGNTSPLRQAYDFYRRPTADAGSSPPDDDHGTEFHHVVSRLADHPMLLRALGLLIDLAMPASALASSATPAILRVTPVWPNPDSSPPPGWMDAAHEDLAPTTAYALVGSRFVPAAGTGPLGAPFTLGMLAVADAGPAGAGANERFEIMPFDIDGAALRMVSVAASDGGQPPSAHPDDTGLPALRTAGFGLIDTQRAAEHAKRLQRAEQRRSTEGLLGSPLGADNVISGYRIDIFDDATQRWRSLCRRRTQYSVGDIRIGDDSSGHPGGLLEEGCVRVDSVTTGVGDDALYVHQIVARWDGWSLAASRPDRIADPIVIPPQSFTVGQTHDPGSLPRLRFGRQYRLRVRLADLAGGGLHLEEPGSDEQQSQEFTHLRFEPIAPPELLPTRAYSDGEGQGQLVIRSDRQIRADDYAAAHGYRAYDLRYMFAPKASLELAMQHGVFDPALGAASAASIDQHFGIATRADRDLADINGAQRHGTDTDPGAYYIVLESTAQLPWLPDPLAPLVALRLRSRPIDPQTDQPGTATGLDDEDDHNQHRWRGHWPDYAPIALKLVAGAAGCAATSTATGNTVTVALGQAEQATLDIVSCPGLDDVGKLGVAIWAGAVPDNAHDATTQLVHHGGLRTVTPPHTITVVHAVQRPLIDPSGTFVASRQIGDTDAILRTTELELDIRSTGRIDVHAEWADLDDTVSNPPTSTTFTSHIGSYDVAHVRADAALPTIKHIFGDTRRRRVTYSVTAISRFRDYFGTLTAADPGACTVHGVLGVTDVPSSARPPAPQLRYVMPAFAWSRGNSGGVHHSTRRGGGLRAFMERPWFASGVDEALAVIVSPDVGATHVSLIGQDPIWTTSTPQSPITAHHVLAPSSAQEFLPEAGESLSAMIFPVTFDEQMNCWSADLDLSPLVETSYFPFARLSLCRYQANSIQDVPRLSPPVETEPVQLFPGRDLTVTASASRVTAVLNGVGPSGPTPNTVRAELQVADTADDAADDALIGTPGWTTIAAGDGLLGNQLNLNLPDTGTRPMRVLVTEIESNLSPSPTTSRMIYADTIRLR
jgi:hypothetical protein